MNLNSIDVVPREVMFQFSSPANELDREITFDLKLNNIWRKCLDTQVSISLSLSFVGFPFTNV